MSVRGKRDQEEMETEQQADVRGFRWILNIEAMNKSTHVTCILKSILFNFINSVIVKYS
jgi:hypothetical protein